MLVSFALAPTIAVADEGGIAFWISGQFGSLAAAPQQPGWSFADVYFHSSVSAGGDVAAAREFTIGSFTRTVPINLNVNLNGHADLDVVSASYVFTSPVLGGQLGVGLAGGAGYSNASIDGTLTVAAGGCFHYINHPFRVPIP
jgi:hypothetical protein